MQLFLVTFKLPKNPAHNPRDKKTGKCPLPNNGECTDVTGEHHTVVYRMHEDSTLQGVKEWLENEGHYVTRVEIVPFF